MRKITDMNEVRQLLSVTREWKIKRKVDDWKETDFVVNAEDVDGIIGDLEKEYFFKGDEPWMELRDDGNIAVMYPTCELVSHGLKKPIKIEKNRRYRIKNAPMEFMPYHRYLCGQMVVVTGEKLPTGKYPIHFDEDIPHGSREAQAIREDLLEEI